LDVSGGKGGLEVIDLVVREVEGLQGMDRWSVRSAI
jgi:hypothetical protein